MIAQIAEGHVDLADLLFLFAAIIFALLVLITLVARPVNGKLTAVLMPLGLTLFSVAWFVL